MMYAMSLGQLIASTRQPERRKKYQFNPSELAEPITEPHTGVMVSSMKEMIDLLSPHNEVGIETKGKYFGAVQRTAHTYAKRNLMRIKTSHEDGIIWIRQIERFSVIR
jgi:hypothetical protein